MRINIALQHDEKDCGPVCIKIMAQHFGSHIALSECRKISKTNQNGTSIYGLVCAGESLGLKSEAKSGNIEDLLTSISDKTISFPFVAHNLTEDGFYHFYVVFGLKRGKFIISDPALGKRIISIDKFEQYWTGYIVTFQKTDDFVVKNECRNSFLQQILAHIKNQKKLLLKTIIFSIFTTLIGVLGSYIFQFIIDDFSKNESNNYTTIVFSSLIALYFIQFLSYFSRGICISNLSKNIDTDISLPYFDKLLSIPIEELETRTTGDYISRYDDISSIRNTLAETSISLILDCFLLFFSIIALISIDLKLFLIACFISSAYIIIAFLFKSPLRKLNTDIMSSNSIIQSKIKEIVNSANTIRNLSATEFFYHKLKRDFLSQSDKIRRGNILFSAQCSIISFVENIGYTVILWIGVYLSKSGAFSLGSLITFYSLLTFFIQPIKNMVELHSTLQVAKVASERLNDIMEIGNENLNNTSNQFVNGDIVINNFNYQHHNDVCIFKNLNLTLKSNSKNAIIGNNGCGKTTLAKILSGLYTYEDGSIKIGETEIKDLDVKNLRENVIYISQNDAIFNASLKDNLTFGKSIDEETIKQVCNQCSLYFANSNLNDIYLEENGNNLSTGQKQKIFLIRALLKNPKIIILDEITSNMDISSENEVIHILNNLNDTTIIFITNNIKSASQFDSVYKIENHQIKKMQDNA